MKNSDREILRSLLRGNSLKKKSNGQPTGYGILLNGLKLPFAFFSNKKHLFNNLLVQAIRVRSRNKQAQSVPA
jgi:hypothetical protein